MNGLGYMIPELLGGVAAATAIPGLRIHALADRLIKEASTER